ncbi:MAG: Conserved putative secreted protein [Frankiales bacterium]|nr:Conserved putative secreted protein [Frankiales bacterium]
MNPRLAHLRTSLVAVAALLPLSACASSADTHVVAATSQSQVIRYQGSAGAVTLPELAESLGLLGNVTLKWVGNTISGPQDIQSVATDQTDVGGAINAAIAKLVAAGAPLESVIGYYGSDDKSFLGYYTLEDSPIHEPRDLIGKKVGVNTLGAHFEAALDAWLAKGGLTPAEIKEVELVVLPPVNTEQALRAGQIDVATLNGILQDKAVAAGGVRKLFADRDLFGDFTAGSYVFRKNFIAANPDTVRQFTAGVAKAIEWERATPREQVIAKFTEIVAKRGRDEDPGALQYWKSNGVTTTGGLLKPEDFSRWIDWLVKHGDVKPEQIDAKSLFTNEFNPYAVGAAASTSATASAKG